MSSNKKKVESALAPKNQTSPFGSLSVKGKGVSYNPKYQPGQEDILKLAPQNEASLLSGDLPLATGQFRNQMNSYLGNLNNLTADNMVNPQVYEANYNLLANPLLLQYKNSLNDLEGKLAAKNLTGGSYDAMAKGQLHQGLMQNLGQAANQAVNNGLGATSEYLGLQNQGAGAAGNQLGVLGGLANNYQGLSSSLQSQLMNPFQQYTQYQGTINPLQQQLANYYQYMPTGLQQGLGAFAQFTGSPLAGAASNAFGNPYAPQQDVWGNSAKMASSMASMGKAFGGM